MVKKSPNLKIHLFVLILFISVNISFYAQNSNLEDNLFAITIVENEHINNPLNYLDNYFEKKNDSDLILKSNNIETTLAPIANCKDITVSLDATGNASILAEDINDGSNGGIGTLSYSADITNFSCANIGVPVIVTLTVTDNFDGSTDTCSATITVIDSTDPVLTPEASQNVTLNANCEISIPNLVDGSTATDNCAITISQAPTAGTTQSAVHNGTYNVTVTATDAAGNSDSKIVVLTALDSTDPVLTPEASQNVTLNANCEITIPNLVDGSTATDNCAVTISQAPTAGTTQSAVHNGNYNVTVTATDAAGNSDSKIVVLTALDSTDPILTPEASQNVTLNANCEITIPNLVDGSTATDNCSVTISQVPTAGTTQSAVHNGTYNITVTATDAAGNSDSKIVVLTALDSTDPILTPEAAQNVTLNANCEISIPNLVDGSTATDNCAVTISQVPTAGTTQSAVHNGNYNVTVTATDAAGNSDSKIVVLTALDSTDPVLTPEASQNVTLNANCEITIPNLVDGSTATDNCSVTISQVPTAGTTQSAVHNGTYNITVTATDAAGNSDSKIVVLTALDSTDPILTPEAAQNVTLNANCEISIPNLVDGSTATDKCAVTISQVPTAGTTQSAVHNGNYNVTVTATDAAGNSDSKIVVLTALDSTDPVLTPEASQNVTLNANCEITIPNLVDGSTATDNCSVTISQAPTAGTTQSAVHNGTYNVTVTATDAAGNSDSKIVVLTALDSTDPILTPEASQNVTLNANCEISIPNLVDGSTATDNCAVTISQAPTAGTTQSAVHNGTYNVTVTATDAAGNSDSKIVVLTALDSTDPILTPEASQNVTLNANCEITIPNLVDGSTATDNCSVTISQAPTAGTTQSAVHNGTYNVTVTATDAAGNSDSKIVVLTALDTTPPTANNLASIFVQCSSDIPAPDISLITTADDNCTPNPIVAFQSDISDGHFNPEVITRSYSITDEGSNQIFITQKITIQDTENPVIADLPDLSADCSLTVTPPEATDNCDGTIMGVTGVDLTFNTIGTDKIYWTFTDSSGNSIIKEQNITINDNIGPKPDITTLPEINITGCQITDISDLAIPTATDFCDGPIQGSLSDGFVFPFAFSGTQTIDWEFVDSNGNVTIQQQDITLTPIPIAGGILDGTFESTVFNNEIDISSCGVAISIDLNLSNENGTIVQWEKFAVNHGLWEIITDSDGDDNKYTASFPIGALESTYYRVLVQTGTCSEYSNQFFVRALPAGDPPDVNSLDPDNYYCLGEEVSLEATSNYVATQESIPDSSGDFNQGQLNTQDPDGWLVDGDPGGFTAGGSATKPRNWSAKTCNNQFNGNIEYCGGDGKYAIAYGDYSDNKYKGPDPSTLETPILDFSNAESASLDFDQAYNFVNDDYAIIEISIDGGVTYSTLRLIHAVGSGPLDWYTAGTAESVVGSDATHYNFETDNTSIDLSAYLGESNVRIKWTFSGTSSQSAWAMDNIEVYKEELIDTEIEWTDGIGDPDESPIAEGETSVQFSFTPDAPGFHQYGGTALINGCRTYDEAGTALIDVYVSYSYAGEDVIYTNLECGKNTVQLNAYDNRLSATQNAAKGSYTLPSNCINCDDDGTGDEGIWTISPDPNNSCGTGTLSDATDPNAIFTGEAGTYILTWTVNGCESNITVEIKNCAQVDFDGNNDYIDFGENNFNLDNETFSIEAWIKPESISGTQSIFSKRDANYSGNKFGYDLTIVNGIISFNWNQSGTINSTSNTIGSDRWYHIAITHTSGLYKLYVDGILINSKSGGPPKLNNYKAILGAMDSSSSNEPSNYFNGWIDEVRIWNVGLSSDQLHQMMNQKIENVSGNVQGEIIPININGLSWSNLLGYYQMESTDVACGYLNSTAGLIKGKLKNISTNEDQTAPIPYTSSQNGNWDSINTWTQPSVWNAPNSLGINGSPINWNIVKLSNEITSSTRNITLLGLVSDSGKLTMDGSTNMTTGTGTGQELWITHYLKLDGIIDLEGESQLIQKKYTTTQYSESILDAASSGFIERDQQGQGNLYNYDDWSSPVGLIGESQTAPYSVHDVLKDGRNSYGADINFTTAKDGDMSTTPITVSSRWIYSYKNGLGFVRGNLERKFNAGEGNTMKGSLSAAEASSFKQNFVFIGKPHNGDIQLPISDGNYYLVGNPYPSALDGDQFILDNLDSTTGILEFYEDWSTDNTHIEGKASTGYAYYSLAGGVGSGTGTPAKNTNNPLESGTKTPERYIPIGQAFWVVGDGGGNIKFNNNQREFATEANSSESIFFKGPKSKASKSSKVEKDSRLKLRIGFETSNVKNRQLLLTIDQRATDKIDKGFDAQVSVFQDNDLYWLNEDKKLVIQALGELTKESVVPVGISIKEKSAIKIKVDTINNAYEGIEVFLRDNTNKETYDILNSEFEIELEAGEYNNKYSVVFKPKNNFLEEDEILANNLNVHFDDNNLIIVRVSEINISKISVFNIIGQQIKTWSDIAETKEIIIPLNIVTGAYIAIIETDKGSYTQKIIKN